MPWYGFSLIAMFASGWYSISQKWALNLKIRRTNLLIYLFFGLFVGYTIYAVSFEFQSFIKQITSSNFLLWGLLAGIFSLIGNIFHTKAIKKSPNPGYVQAIIATNALLILILSALIFRSPITIAKLVGIIIVLVGLYTLVIEKRGSVKHAWKLPAFLAMISYGSMTLVVKQMIDLGISPAQVLVAICFYVLVGLVIIGRVEKVPIGLSGASRLVILPICLSIILALTNNLLNYIAIKIVPNPGYSQALFNSGMVLTLIFSRLVFPKEAGGEINLKKWLAVIIVLAGILFIILG